jgi:hypothetical protein
MALAYAFIDEHGTQHGEDNPQPPHRTFAYVPATGWFVGQRLVVHASSWDGTVSATRLREEGGWSCAATAEVEALLGMEQASPLC